MLKAAAANADRISVRHLTWVVLLFILVGCGSHSAAPTTAVTATPVPAGNRIAPVGAPYAYSLPAGFRTYARTLINHPAAGTSYRSTVGLGPDDLVTVYVIDGAEATGVFDAQFKRAMRAQGVVVNGPAHSVVAATGAITYQLRGLRGPTGLTAEAQRTFVFTAQRVVVVSCQWTSRRARASLLSGCASIQRSLALTQ